MALNTAEKQALFSNVRSALKFALRGQSLPMLDIKQFSPVLQKPAATFVTLTKAGSLRGCIGTLEASLPLVQSACDQAVAAALNDYRFPPVQLEEMDQLEIEVSILSPLQPVEYLHPDELISKVRPGVDGVLIQAGFRRATFLPQVWEKIPDPVVFFNQLCRKMGAEPNFWQKKPLSVFTYQVEALHEGDV